MKEEKIMALIDWEGDTPYLITVCRPTPRGNVYAAFEVVNGELEPYQVFLNGPETPLSFDDVDESTLQLLYDSATKALIRSIGCVKASQVAVT